MWTINNNQILKDGLLIATVVNRELIYERCLRIPINILTQANVHPIIIKRIREDDSEHEYKMQTIKSAKELGDYAKATTELDDYTKAATELGISKNTLYGWMKAVREGRLSIGENEQSTFSQSEVTLNEELVQLRKQVKAQEKEIKRLKMENEFLEEASAFFAASRLKLAKTRE